MTLRNRKRPAVPVPPVVQDYFQPHNVAARRQYTQRWFRFAARVAGRVGAGAGALVAAGLAPFARSVPRLDTGPITGRMEVDFPTQTRPPRKFGLGRQTTTLVQMPGVKRPAWYRSNVGVSQAGVAGGATWQGNFRGRKRRGTGYSSTTRGYSETVKVAGSQKQYGCTYLGITSFPALDSTDNVVALSGSGKVCGRVFKDICVALVRHYFRHFHAGRLEFTTPDQFIISLIAVPSLTLGNVHEDILVQYSDSTGGNIADVGFRYIANGSTGTYNTIVALGNAIAIDMYTKWRLGLYPRLMYASRYQVGGSTEVLSHGRLFLDQLRVSARCTTVLRVQNQSAAADNSSGILDVDANPLQGKLFYFKRIAPAVATGHAMGTVNNDSWGELNLMKPIGVSVVGGSWNQAPYLENVYTSSTLTTGATADAPTGCWGTLPKAAYFKNCVGEKSVQMEPGVMKQFALRFRFKGKLTDWLRADASNFGQADTTTGLGVFSTNFSRGMGQCAILVVEKRIRDFVSTGNTVPIQLSFEVDTYIHADVSHIAARMANHLETGFNAL